MPDHPPTELETAFSHLFGNGYGITSFTCDSAVTLSVAGDETLEVFQIIVHNPTTGIREAAYGGT